MNTLWFVSVPRSILFKCIRHLLKAGWFLISLEKIKKRKYYVMLIILTLIKNQLWTTAVKIRVRSSTVILVIFYYRYRMQITRLDRCTWVFENVQRSGGNTEIELILRRDDGPSICEYIYSKRRMRLWVHDDNACQAVNILIISPFQNLRISITPRREKHFRLPPPPRAVTSIRNTNIWLILQFFGGEGPRFAVDPFFKVHAFSLSRP